MLFQKYFYESLDNIERSFLHESAGNAIEIFFGDRVDTMAVQLARHYSEAGITTKAVHYQLLSGARARSTYANTESMAHLYQALETMEKSLAEEFEQGGYESTMAEICTLLGKVLETSGEFANARMQFEQALALTSRSDRLTQVRLHRRIATSYEREHKHDAALATLERSAAILDEGFDAHDPDEMSEWISIRNSQLWIHYWQANTDQMQELSKQTEQSVICHGSASQQRRYFSAIAGLGNRLDGFLPSDATLEASNRVLDAARQDGSQFGIADGLFQAGFFRMLRGEARSAMDYFSEALKVAERIGDRTMQARCLTYLGVLKRRAGDLDGIEEFLQPALEICESIGMQEYVAVVYANRSWIAWKKDDSTRAIELATLALEAWQKRAPRFPFKWLACLQLIDIELKDENLAVVTNYDLIYARMTSISDEFLFSA